MAQSYCLITPEFLYKTCVPEFKIYSKVAENDEDYSQVAVYTSGAHQNILAMMTMDPGRQYFINENTLVQYYSERIKKLKVNLSKMGLPPIDQIKALYQLASEIMQEYYEKGASAKIFRTLEEIAEMLDPCILSNNISFIDIFKITAKENLFHAHSVNVGFYSLMLGNAFKMNDFARRELFLGCMLSDVGKKTIPDAIKLKKGILTPEEFKEIRKHSAVSRKILNDLRCYSENILRMAGEHHEKLNGTGYPKGLSGESIALSAKICSLMDVFSALTSDRFHRPRYNPMQAMAIIKNEMTGSFDDRIFVNFVKSLTVVSAPTATAKV
jgi:HD-GYP domain-containing protein (c-di-GMP phosphodiesterase class II)